MSAPIVSCWTKATRREAGTPRRSFNWLMARRARFQLFDDRVECGNWVLPFSELNEAVLYEGKSLGMATHVLEMQMDGGVYQFGLNAKVSIADHLPFPVARQPVKFGYSAFSIAFRLTPLALLALLLWR